MGHSIFLVTNRDFRRGGGSGGYELRDAPNRKGARELRLFEAEPLDTQRRDWSFSLVPERPRAADFDGLDTAFLEARSSRRRLGSDLVAARLVKRLRDGGRHLVFFVHGYNTNAKDAVRRAHRLAARYDVEVVVFSWPANGGGDRFVEDVHGTASYKSDKSDARSSTEALDRALARMQGLIAEMNDGVLATVRDEVRTETPEDGEERRRRLAERLRSRVCPFNVTLVAHSMGNYLYKKMLLSSDERLSRDTVFDNVILKAADTNHACHAQWVERIRARRRIYILINQNDAALQLSTLKLGELQKTRLGNTLARQNAGGATYLDLTGYLGDQHSYFDGRDVERADAGRLEGFFEQSLRGGIAERDLPYSADTNTYRLE